MKISFNRYNDLEPSNINCDYHIHTTQTDGHDTIDSILKKANECNLSKIAFTEHVRRDTEWFDEFVDSVKESAELFPNIQVFVGCEAKILDKNGNLDVPDRILRKSDIVIGSVHRIPNNNGGFINFDELSPKELATTELELSLAMLEKSPIDVLGHPGGMYSCRHGGYPIEYFKIMMEIANRNGKAIEINSRYIKNFYDFTSACAFYNPLVSIGSDAHSISEVANCKKIINLFINNH